MRVAISSKGRTRNDQVESRFDRAAYFLVVDTEDMVFHAIKNQVKSDPTETDGVRLVLYIGAEAVLTGDCGPDARHMLTSSGVRVFQGVSGTVGATVERFRRGWLAESPDPGRTCCGAGSGGTRGR